MQPTIVLEDRPYRLVGTVPKMALGNLRGTGTKRHRIPLDENGTRVTISDFVERRAQNLTLILGGKPTKHIALHGGGNTAALSKEADHVRVPWDSLGHIAYGDEVGIYVAEEMLNLS